jgi:hypothetical protein
MTYDTNLIWIVYGSIEAPRSIERGASLKEYGRIKIKNLKKRRL